MDSDTDDFDFDINDVCISEFIVEKYTLASSDSYRETEMTLLIFPEAEFEFAPHFKQDYCARQSKISLPYSCFKIHAPQTWQHHEGYLSVEALENEFSKKFYAVLNGYSDNKFDAFFDYSMGFWVEYLDKYLQRINDNYDILTDYIGLRWYSESIGKTFYSLIIHSPSSQKVYELISFNKPDLSQYANLRKDFKFVKINEARASFLASISEEKLPWEREDGGDIQPIQISFGCSDITEQIEFYTNVMEAKLLLQENDITSNLDGHIVHYAFLQPVNDRMEIKFVQRPVDYTYGKFTTELYKNLLVSTHNDVITSPVCGLDRWFDNHYGYGTLSFAEDEINYNFLDRVLASTRDRDDTFRLYHTPYEDESPEGKYWMKEYGFDDTFQLYIFDGNGQTIQMIGAFRETITKWKTPIYHKQWCYVECPGQQTEGDFDQSQIYIEDTDDIVYKAIIERRKKFDRNGMTLEELADKWMAINGQDDEEFGKVMELGLETDMIKFFGESMQSKASRIALIACISIAALICLLVVFCACRCVMREGRDRSNYGQDEETTALLDTKT